MTVAPASVHWLPDLSTIAKRYERSGLNIIHLDLNVKDTGFLLSFVTPAENNHGAAHVLEHLVLCGSHRYPMNSPFFRMNGRSVNTYLNAFTTADATSYAFATPDKSDFYSLAHLVCDLVFCPLLRDEDFRREAWRPSTSGGGIDEYTGIVLNEMRSDEQSENSRMWRYLSAALFPDLPYRFVTGGIPDDIVNLTIDEVRRFHQRLYAPTNAYLFVYGAIDLNRLFDIIDGALVSGSFQPNTRTIIPRQPRFDVPRYSRIIENKFSSQATAGHNARIMVGWLLPEVIDLELRLRSQLLRNLLVGRPWSPLKKVLADFMPGAKPSSIMGLEKSYRELIFATGIQCVQGDSGEPFTAYIEDLLRTVTRDVALPAMIQDALDALELDERTVGGDSVPWGLQLIMKCLPIVRHGGTLESAFSTFGALNALRREATDPSVVIGILDDLLVENPHRVTVVAESIHAPQVSNRSHPPKARAEAPLSIQDDLENNRVPHDEDCQLPCVLTSSISRTVSFPNPSVFSFKTGSDIYQYSLTSNGVIDAEVVWRAPRVSKSASSWLHLFGQTLARLGREGAEAGLASTDLAIGKGVINSTTLSRSVNSNGTPPFVVTHVRALQRNAEAALQELNKICFGDYSIRQERLTSWARDAWTVAKGRVSFQGHSYAMGAASRGFNEVTRFRYDSIGLSGIERLHKVHTDIGADKSVFNEVKNAFEEIRGGLRSVSPTFFLAASDSDILGLSELFGRQRGGHLDSGQPWSYPERSEYDSRPLAWLIPERTFHCCRSWPAPDYETEDSAILTVLSKFLQVGFLHSMIREAGGAYGSGAANDLDGGAFHMYSYRDPRFLETFGDFDIAIDRVFEDRKGGEELLNAAVLGAIKSVDKPMSPTSEARVDFHSRLFGRSPELRAERRNRILDTTIEDLRRICEKYLKRSSSVDAVLAPLEARDRIPEGWMLRVLSQ